MAEGFDRGTRSARFGAAVLGALVAIAGTGAASAAPGRGRHVSVTVHEGTSFAVAASPDRRRIVIDMQDTLWSLPFGGGRARRLTDSLTPATQPDFSPDGRTIFFQGYVGNNFHLWSVRPDGTGLRRLTSGRYDDREPRVSPDGRQVAFSSDRGGSYDLWVLDLSGGGITRLTTTPGQESQPAWSPDGRMLAFVVDNTRIDARDASGAVRTMFAAPAGTSVAAPSWAPDGVRIAYTVSDLPAGPLAPSGSPGLPNPTRSRLFVSGQPVSGGEDVFPLRPLWLSDDELLYGADGKIRRRSLARGSASAVRFAATFSFRRPRYAHRPRSFRSTERRPVRGIADPVLSPDGRRVAFGALNDLWVMRIGGAPRRITRDGFSEFRPTWSPDGRQIAYSSDRAGIAEVWIHDLASGRERQVTRGGAAKLVGAWSPDGGSIAYMDSAGRTSGLWTVDVRSGQTTQVHAPLFLPGRPTWSADGGTIALAALVPFSGRFREGLNQILNVDLAGGADRYTAPIPFKSLSDRVAAGPVWSPDGTRMAFVMGGVLWVMPVDARGRQAGAPRQITREVADAPSWSGDSRRLLYLSGRRLRIVTADGRRTRSVPLRLTWRPARPRGRKIIHAGALWDGRSRRLRRDVDVVVAGNRIVAVRRHRADRAGRARRIDARRLTVMPGLIAAHDHVGLTRRDWGWGDRVGRLWLSYGFTTTRSPGENAQSAVEDREAKESGRRVGPRLVTAGELLEGSRAYYNIARSVSNRLELTRELERSRALRLDLLKGYVRLPVRLWPLLARGAHRLGVPVTSHYLWPWIALGGNSVEHIDATDRNGYTPKQDVLGNSYQDVVDLLARSGTIITPTLFEADILYDDAVLSDPRVTALFPPWEYSALQHAVANGRRRAVAGPGNLATQVRVLRRIVRRGGHITVGADSPLGPPALMVELNLQAYVRYGLTPYQALRAATVEGARLIGHAGDLGTVERGKLADLAFVRGNPLRRIKAVADVRLVMKNGTLYSRRDLLGPFAHAAADGG